MKLNSKLEEPKDLGITVGTKEQIVWEQVKKESLVLIEQSKQNLMIQTEILALAERKIQEEKEKYK